MSVERTLRYLAQKPAVQLQDKPLVALEPLLRAGWARLSRRYVENYNDRIWHCEEFVITNSGREKLRKIDERMTSRDQQDSPSK